MKMNLDLEPKVSIILPTYNGASKYLYKSINSCLEQTYRNIELVIVDDGSDDHTPELVKSIADPRIRYIPHEKNMGLPRSLNTGFRNSTGQLLTWTSDDNEYLPEAIEHMVAFLRDHGEADFVYADYYALFVESGKSELRRLPHILDLAWTNCIGACFLYTRRVYVTVGNYDPRHALVEDYDYWIRVSKQFKMLHLPKPLYVYREHPRSLKSTRYHSAVLFDNILRFERRYIFTRQLAQVVFEFCHATLKTEKTVFRSAIVWFQTLLRSLDLSVLLGLLFIALSLNAVIKLLRRRTVSILNYLFEPIRFVLSYYYLKPGHEAQNVMCLCPSLVAGGAEAVMLSIGKALMQKGYCFHLLAKNGDDNAWRGKFLSTFRNVVLIDSARGDDTYFKYLRAMVPKLGIKVILISNSREGYRCVPRLSSTFPDIKIVDVLHAERYVGTSDELLWAAPYIHRRVCISNRLRNYMLERYQAHQMNGQHASRLKVIHNGVDEKYFSRRDGIKGKFKSRFGIPDGTRIISYVGRFAVEKQPLLFVQIAELLTLQTPPGTFKFVMAGDGDQFQKIKDRISLARLEHSFILTGLIDSTEELLADTYLLLIVSKSEGIPLVVLEALSMSVPVISTQVGAINEVIKNGVNGYLIPPTPDIVERYASKVRGLLADDNKHASLSMNARPSIIPEHSLETMGKLYEEVFEGLTDGR